MMDKVYTIKDDQVFFSGFACECGFSHNIPDIDIYIGSNLLGRCSEYLAKRELGTRAVLVADRITYELAGRYIQKQLTEQGYRIILCLLEREGELEPDQNALGEVLLSLEADTQFLIAVGSGSITDITRYAAFHTGRPFVSIGTAPSMDGYTSVVAPLLFNGLKVNKPASCPVVIICDLDVMKSAPPAMFISGVGDVLGKYIAKADWVLGNIINHEGYCPLCGDMVMQAVEECILHIDDIKGRTTAGTRVLIEALILAGVTILIIGNTRAVASVEHNMSHYWEMMMLAAKEKPPAHGTAVGVGTVYGLQFYDYFLKMKPRDLDIAWIQNHRLLRPQREQEMIDAYGEKIAAAIMDENPEDFLEWEEQKRRITTAAENWEKIRQAVMFLPTADEMTAVLGRLGAPVTAQEIGVSDQLLLRTLQCSKDYRSRYNVCKTLAEWGRLDEAIAKITQSKNS